jgi:hypothetical protein
VLDDFIASFGRGGSEAWGPTTSAQLMGPAILISTDWTPATVDEDLANQICGAAYQ